MRRLLVTGVFVLAAACGGGPEIDAPTTTAPMRSATLAATSAPVSSTAVATTSTAVATTTTVGGVVDEVGELTAVCTFDESVPSFSCTATGVPKGAGLRWESNVAGWATDATYEVPLVEEHQFVAEVVVELRACVGSNCETAVTTVDLSVLLEESQVDPAAGTTEAPPTTVQREVVSLAAVCWFDESGPNISCAASGVPDGAGLRWESSVAGWSTDPIYEVALVAEHQLVAQVVVMLEACLALTCEQAETTIDTSALVADVDSGGPTVATTTVATTTVATTTVAAETSTTAPDGQSSGNDDTGSEPSDPVSVVIELLACDDDRITARYETTCRAELSGHVDWVGWGFENGDVHWDRTENADIALEDVLVQQVTRSGLGEYVLEFAACTGGHKWASDSICVEGTTALQVVSSADWGDIPCESDPEPVFDRWILDSGLTDEIWATGTATHSGTSQHSYVYPRYDLEPAGVPVYAPVDSYLTYAGSTLTYDNGVKDYGLTFVVSCEVSFKFGHVVNPDQRIVDRVAGELDGTWSVTPALWGVTEQIDPVFFEAGEVLFRHLPNRPGTNQGFDYGVFNTTRVNQFLNSDRWSQWDTFFHSGCPFDYLAEPARSQVVALIREGTCHGVNREVVGTLAGMWHFDDPNRAGGDLVFVEYFDDLIHVAGLNSSGVETEGVVPEGEFILRLASDQTTYRLPQEVTTSHCYEGSNALSSADIEGLFDYMFVYAEIVDDLTVNVAFADGTCPATLPAEYTTYVR